MTRDDGLDVKISKTAFVLPSYSPCLHVGDWLMMTSHSAQGKKAPLRMCPFASFPMFSQDWERQRQKRTHVCPDKLFMAHYVFYQASQVRQES